MPGARVVAIKAELDAIYARYPARGRVAGGARRASRSRCCSRCTCAARRRLAAVALPIAAATLVVLAALALAGAALGILHLVGLLLTVAIGSNYALFFDHLRERGEADADTLASLLLANLTTVDLVRPARQLAAFRCCRRSAIVVAPGALLCLVFSAAWLGRARGRRRGAWENRARDDTQRRRAACRRAPRDKRRAVAGAT